MSQSSSLPNEGVCFDPDEISLLGIYSDELALFRARRKWNEILERAFMLEGKQDFVIETVSEADMNAFRLVCRFNTACGRYAFWRLTNAQAPEAQYEIETAHIPNSPSRNLEMTTAPDLMPVFDTPLIVRGIGYKRDSTSRLKRVIDSIRKLMKKD